MKLTTQEVELFASDFLDYYQSVAQTKYVNLLNTNPESLRLYNKENLKVYRIQVRDDFFPFDDYLFFIYSKNGNFELVELDFTNPSYYIYDTPTFEKEPFELLIENVHDIFEPDIIHEIVLHAYIKAEKFKADQLLSKEALYFRNHVNQPQSYYAKNAAKYAYSEMDLNPIIEKVNDPDFSYQIDQAIAAYDNSLFLPACATLGVCLETVCKLLLIKKGAKVKDSDTTLLDQLGLKLRERKIISYKLNNRIDVCYKVRNLASHTSPGKVVKQDCHFILNTISEIVDTHF
ncbi:hypothetical protein [Oceanobacillus kimchii]|uniref:hypothetical protein n=1 Tax=Oceanobacillus kimchii TaxID=746691 RepID=UPI003B013F06